MDATMFDGIRTSPLTAETAAGHGTRAYTWYDIDLTDPGSAREAVPILTALGVPDDEQSLLLKPNRTAVIQVKDPHVRCVLWLGGDTDGQAPPEIHVLWSNTAMITVRWGGDASIDLVRRQVAARAEALFADPSSVLSVVLTLMNGTVDRRLTALDLELFEIDDGIVAGHGSQMRHRLRLLRGEVSALQLRYASLSGVVSSAVVDPSALPGMTDETAATLQAYATHVSDTYQHVRELATGARGALQDYQASVSDRQGDRINQLTIVSVVFLPISFLTGYFGMNFDWLDDQLMSAVSWVVWGVALPLLTLALSVVALRMYGFLRSRRPPRTDDVVADDPVPSP